MVEKVMVCSDIHDDLEALAAFTNFTQIRQAERILILGDFNLRPYSITDLTQYREDGDKNTFIQAKRKYSRQILIGMKQILDQTKIPFNVIPGNYDGNADLEAVFQEHNLHQKTTTLGNTKVVGYGGADAFPPHIKLLSDLNEILPFSHHELYDLLTREEADICMTHDPPYSLCDNMFNGQNVGTPGTLQYIVESHPKLVLCGHIHEAGPSGNNPQGIKGVTATQDKNTKEVTYVLNPGNLGRFKLINPETLNPIRQFDFGTFMEVNIREDGTPLDVTAYTLQIKGRRLGDVKQLYKYKL